MTGSHNLASLTAPERRRMAADRIACLIRHKLGDLKGDPRKKLGRELLEMVPSHMRGPVIDRLKARASP